MTARLGIQAWDCPRCGWRVAVRTLANGALRVYAHKAVGGPGDGEWCDGTAIDLSRALIRRRVAAALKRGPATLLGWALRMQKGVTHFEVWDRKSKRWRWVKR